MKLRQFFSSGVFIAILGIVLFSGKAVLVKLAYQYNVSSIHLLLFRMLFSLPFYIGIALYYQSKNEKRATKKEWIWIVFFGFIGYYLASYFDFMGLQYIKAGLERIILFIYPTLVILISRVFFKRKVSFKEVLAILISYLGIVITFWGEISFDSENILLGAGFIFLSALTFASYIVGSGWLIPKIGATLFTSYAMLVSTLCVCVHYLITDRTTIFTYTTEVYIIGIMMAVFCTVIPSFLTSFAIKKLSASRFSIIGSIGPISTIILAYFFLGETLSYLQMIGAAVVILGITFVKNRKK